MSDPGATSSLAPASERRPPGRPAMLSVPHRAHDGLALSSFVALGLPDGTIGPAWPALRHGFGAPLADLGIVLLLGTMGGVASSSFSGLLLGRIGVRGTVILGSSLGAMGAVGIVLSPAFWAFAVSGVGIGASAALIDGSLNTASALSGRNRLLNMLHGSYGIGTSLAPLIVTAALLAGQWRAAYGLLAVVEVALVLGWWALGRRAALPAVPSPGEPSEVPAPDVAEAPITAAPLALSRRRFVATVLLGLLVFMLYVGLEVAAGQWGPSFDRGFLHLGTGATGLVTFGYWGALTLGRFGLAAPRRPFPPAAIVRWSCALALAGAAILWWRPSDTVALLGFVLIGGACAGVFPALVALTPGRVGDEMAKHVIGWQIGASSIGGSVIPAGLGLVFQHWGLRYFGPALVAVGLALMAGVLLLERMPAVSK